MQATKFEFERRFFVFSVIFLVAFVITGFARTNLAQLAAGGARGLVLEGIGHSLMIAGAAVTLAGAALRSWATAYLRWDIVHDPAQHSGPPVADGPYRYVRNPLYTGVILVCIGFAPALAPVAALWLILAIYIFIRRLIAREEAGLAAADPAGFGAFCAAVPRLVPALRPALPAGGRQPAWGAALGGEFMFWCFGFGQLFYGLTGQPAALSLGAAIGGAGYGIMLAVIARRKALRQGDNDAP